MSISTYVLVDANIAKALSDPATAEIPLAVKGATDALFAKSCPTGVIFTPELLSEWHKHATAVMRRWLVMMENRGRILRKDDKVVAEFRKAIKTIKDAGIRNAVNKDRHISEAAIAHGAGVVSLDDKQRKYLYLLSQNGYLPVGRIFWVNPVTDADCLNWLETGCSAVYELRCSDKRP